MDSVKTFSEEQLVRHIKFINDLSMKQYSRPTKRKKHPQEPFLKVSDALLNKPHTIEDLTNQRACACLKRNCLKCIFSPL